MEFQKIKKTVEQIKNIKDINDFEPEVKANIAKYQDMCVEGLFDGKEYADWKPEYTLNYIKYVYKIAELENHPCIFVAKSPRDYAIAWNYLFNENMNSKFSGLQKELVGATEFQVEALRTKYDALLQEELEVCGRDVMTAKQKKAFEKVCQDPQYHWLYLTNEYARAYLMWYRFLKDHYDVTFEKEEELETLQKMINPAHIAKCYFSENETEKTSIVLVLLLPKEIRKNAEGFHNTSDTLGALIHDGDYPYHFINGRNIEAEIIESYHNGTMTFEKFNSLENEEDKAAVVTLITENKGQEGLLEFLGAELVDEIDFNHPEETVYELTLVDGKAQFVPNGTKPGYKDTHKLYRTKDKFTWASDSKGNTNVKLAWQQMQCASTNQTYLISICPTIKTAEEGAKFLRPSQVPKSVPYVWQSAN